jgi:hypothetical protein
MKGDNRWGYQETSDHVNNGKNDMDMKRKMGSRSKGIELQGNEQSAGTKGMGRGSGRGWPHHTQNGPKRCLSSFGQASFLYVHFFFFFSFN